MNANSEAIVIFCSRMRADSGAPPLAPKEWRELTERMTENNLQPGDVLGFSAREFAERLQLDAAFAERLARLTQRSAVLSRMIAKYEELGIRIMTRADEEYPVRLERALKRLCPPILYYAGDARLLRAQTVGYVGARDADEAALAFTERTVGRTAAHGYGVVTGGARGVDSAAERAGLKSGPVISYLAGSLLRRLNSSVRAVRDGNLILLAAVPPEAEFTAGAAMTRNRLIYAQSAGTVVVKADYNRGGTWAGASENLKNGWCKEFCWDRREYAGNPELIRRGAIPIDAAWDGDVAGTGADAPVQTGLFDEKN